MQDFLVFPAKILNILCFLAKQSKIFLDSRNSNWENRQPTGDRSSDDPCPEVRFSSYHSGDPNSSEVEDYPHNFLAWWIEEFDETFCWEDFRFLSLICQYFYVVSYTVSRRSVWRTDTKIHIKKTLYPLESYFACNVFSNIKAQIPKLQ